MILLNSMDAYRKTKDLHCFILSKLPSYLLGSNSQTFTMLFLYEFQHIASSSEFPTLFPCFDGSPPQIPQKKGDNLHVIIP